MGLGSERVEEELHRDFPTARIARLDRDTRHRQAAVRDHSHDFREGNYDILVGTQMIAKGHDNPNVTLVGVVSADVGWRAGIFARPKRTFSCLRRWPDARDAAACGDCAHPD